MRVQEYIKEDGSNPYQKWFDSLDAIVAAKVTVAKSRLELGNTSSVKWFGVFRAFGEATQLGGCYGGNYTFNKMTVQFLQCLLPGANLLRLESYEIDIDNYHLTLSVSSTQISAHCPLCSTSTGRIHSYYKRTLADLACVSFSLTNGQGL